MIEGLSIPEMLGFAPDEHGRQRAYSPVSYQARYILYEDEAADLLKEFAPDEDAAKYAYPHINRTLHLRYARDPEYKSRVDGGYPEMQRRMEEAGIIPDVEREARDTLNRLFAKDE